MRKLAYSHGAGHALYVVYVGCHQQTNLPPTPPTPSLKQVLLTPSSP